MWKKNHQMVKLRCQLLQWPDASHHKLAGFLPGRFSYINIVQQHPGLTQLQHSKRREKHSPLWFTTPCGKPFTKVIISCCNAHENTSTKSQVCRSSRHIISFSSWPLAESRGSRKTLLVRFTGTIDSYNLEITCLALESVLTIKSTCNSDMYG